MNVNIVDEGWNSIHPSTKSDSIWMTYGIEYFYFIHWFYYSLNKLHKFNVSGGKTAVYDGWKIQSQCTVGTNEHIFQFATSPPPPHTHNFLASDG